MGPCAACELNSSRSHSEVISAPLTCLGFCLRQSKTTMAAQVTEWPILMCDPWMNKCFINEWVSLWDHCTAWGLDLHHSRKFLGHLRKQKLARRSVIPFHQGKALMYFPHFYPDKFYQFNLVALSCRTPCDPMNHSTPGLPVHHQLPESTQTHVHQVGDALQPSHSPSSPSSLAPNTSKH